MKFLEKDDVIGEVSLDGEWIKAEFWGKEAELPAYVKKLVSADYKLLEFKLEKSSLKDAYFGTLGEGE